MKWVKVAIGAVIAIISIGIVATSVYNMTQSKVREEIVTFEVLTLDENLGTVTSGTYDKISLYSEFDVSRVTNTVSILINDVERLSPTFYLSIEQSGRLINDSGSVQADSILTNDQLSTSIYETGAILSLNDVVSITFEVTTPPQLTGISATLILLAPLIFAGGVLAYLLNKQNY